MTTNLVLITQQGLNQINDAHADGSLIDIAYYLPVYDYRIDPNIQVIGGGFSPTDITTVASSADKVPTGEIFWNATNEYAYVQSSPDDCYIVSAVGTNIAGNTVNSPKQKASTAVTLFGGINDPKYPMRSYIKSESTAYYDKSSNTWKAPSPATWQSTPAVTSCIPTDVNNPLQKNLYPGVAYSSVISSGTNKRANFRVTVTSPHGTIKFNKIGLYGVKRYGSDVYGTQPFLFAEVIIPVPQIVSTDALSNGQAGELVLDFQVESKAALGSFDNMIYSSKNDYWQRVSNENGTYGLAYDGNVYVSNRLAVDDKNVWVATSGADTGVAKVFVSTFENINNNTKNEEAEKPQMCLQYVTDATESTKSKRIRTTFRTLKAGHCEVDFYGSCTSGNSLTPRFDDEFGIGIDGHRWRQIFAKRYINVQNEMPDATYDFTIDTDHGGEWNDDPHGIVKTNMDITVEDLDFNNETFISRYFVGNVMARYEDDLLIRASARYGSDEKLYDAPIWMMSSDLWSSNDGKKAPDGYALIDRTIAKWKKNYGGKADWWLNDLKGRSGINLAAPHTTVMGNLVLMGNAFVVADNRLSLGQQEYTADGKLLSIGAFSQIVVNNIVNGGRDIGITSDLIPWKNTVRDRMPNLGAENDGHSWANAWIDNLHVKNLSNSDAVFTVNKINLGGPCDAFLTASLLQLCGDITCTNITATKRVKGNIGEFEELRFKTIAKRPYTWTGGAVDVSMTGSTNSGVDHSSLSIKPVNVFLDPLLGGAELTFIVNENKNGLNFGRGPNTTKLYVLFANILTACGLTGNYALSQVISDIPIKATAKYDLFRWDDTLGCWGPYKGSDNVSVTGTISASVSDGKGYMGFVYNTIGDPGKNCYMLKDMEYYGTTSYTIKINSCAVDSSNWKSD